MVPCAVETIKLPPNKLQGLSVATHPVEGVPCGKTQSHKYDFINGRPLTEAIRGLSNKVFQIPTMRERYKAQGPPTWLAQSLQSMPAALACCE